MNEQDKALQGRRRWLLGSIGAVAAGAAVVSASSNAAQSSAPAAGFVPVKHALDAWMGEIPGIHRAFLDTSTGNGGLTAMNYANNILMVQADDYGGSESDYAMVVCFRHMSTPLGYNDAMWAKYGAALSAFTGLKDSKTDQAFMVNPLNIPGRSDFPSRGHTVSEMAGRGAYYAVCNRATHSISGMLARGSGGDADAIYEELAANLVDDARLVPAGVMAATRSQEYGYSLLYSG
jgi:hypothetical protein